MVKVWPNSAADAMPVKIVATVEEYFFKIVSECIEQWVEDNILYVWKTKMVDCFIQAIFQ